MPKDYLNRVERETMAGALLMSLNLEAHMAHAGKHMTKAERRACAKSQEWLKKLIGHCGARIGSAEVDKITRIATTQELVFKDRAGVVKNDTIEVDVDSFAYVAEAVIEGNCRHCKKDAEGVASCKVRNFMTLADVPALDSYDTCQYRMKG